MTIPGEVDAPACAAATGAAAGRTGRTAAVVRVAVTIAVAGVLASCSGPAAKLPGGKKNGEYFSSSVYGKASPRVVRYGPVPKGGGRKLVGAPYRVAGKTYIPRENPNYSAVGLASWYGAAFHGRKTANGEIYDVNGLTAAHPTLPLPSYARVTNLQNGRSVIVRVNDRGPFAHGRIIDVSARAAGMLGFQKNGTAKVRVDYMGPARMDGRDDKQLLASYRDPASGGGGTMFAWNGPAKTPAPPVRVAMAPIPRVSPAPVPTSAPAAAAAAAGTTGDEPPMILMPPAMGDDDPLAPLIMRTSMATSFAEPPRRSPAQRAAATLANASQTDLQAALNRVAAVKARELRGTTGAGTTIQLGTFGDAANAERVAANFGRFGAVQSRAKTVDGRSLTVVSVGVNAGVAPAMVLDAAVDAGLTGAFIVPN